MLENIVKGWEECRTKYVYLGFYIVKQNVLVAFTDGLTYYGFIIFILYNIFYYIYIHLLTIHHLYT